MRRPRSNSRRPSRKCARASAEEVVMGWLITALVMGSSAERGPCAAAPADQLTDASTSARGARVDAWLTDIIVVPDVGSLGGRWRHATRGRERSLARPNPADRRGPQTWM